MKRDGGRAGELLRVICLGMMLLVLPRAQASFSEIEQVLPRPAPADRLASGARAFLTILCKFADEPGEPEPPAFFERLLGADYPGLGHYWREVSYGQMSLAGSKVIGWLMLPAGKAAYLNTAGAPDLQRLAEDCAGESDIDIDPSEYFGLNLVFNVGLDRSRGGRICLAGARSAGCYGVTWIWPLWFRSQATWAHEMGHALGLNHTGRGAGRQYDNVWDVMSGDGTCSMDAEFGRLAQHVTAYHKDLLGWIPARARLLLPVPAEVTFRLAPLAQPAGSSAGYLLAQIPIDGSADHFYTLEARTRVGYDRHLPADAVVIHEVDLRASQASPARLRWQGAAGSGPEAAVFRDDQHGITVEVRRQDQDGFTVAVRAAATGTTRGVGATVLPPSWVTAVEHAHQAPADLATTAAEDDEVIKVLGARDAALTTQIPRSRYALASDGEGRQHAFWIELNANGSGAFYAIQQPEGAWSDFAAIDAGAKPDGGLGIMSDPALAVSADGGVAAAWLQMIENRWQVHFAMRRGKQGSWIPAERVSSLTMGTAWGLAVALDGHGRAYVLWQWRHDCGGARVMSDLYLSVRTADGRWLADEKVDPITTTHPLRSLRLVADAAGNLYAEWQDRSQDGTATYAAFRPDGGAWSSRWKVTGSHP